MKFYLEIMSSGKKVVKKTELFRKKYIKDPVFHASFWLCVGSRSQFAAFVKKTTLDKEAIDVVSNGDYMGDASYLKCDDRIYFLWLSSNNIFLLIHELIHHVSHSLGIRKIELGEATEEGFAYYYGFVFEECYNFLKSKPKRKKINGNKTNNTRKSSPQ